MDRLPEREEERIGRKLCDRVVEYRILVKGFLNEVTNVEIESYITEKVIE